MSDEPVQNTDREIWRETPGDFYSPSVHVTADGRIGICNAGTVCVRTTKEWIESAIQHAGQWSIIASDDAPE